MNLEAILISMEEWMILEVNLILVLNLDFKEDKDLVV